MAINENGTSRRIIRRELVEGVPMELVRPSGFDIVSQLAIHSISLWVKKFLKS